MTHVHANDTATSSGEDHSRHGFSHRVGGCVIAAAFLIATGFTVITTPL